jgi:hypothetical protein
MRRVGAIHQLVSALAYRRRYVHGRYVPADELQRSDDLGPWQRTLIPMSASPWAILVELPATRRRALGEATGLCEQRSEDADSVTVARPA